MYDESPHKCKIVDFFKGGGHRNLVDSLALALPGILSDSDIVPGALPSKLAGLCASEVGPCKLFQVRSEWSVLLAVSMGDASDVVQYLTVNGEQVNWLQAVDRTTAGNSRQCLHNLSGLPLSSNQFQQSFRGSCMDRASSNKKTERGIRLEDMPKAQHLHVECRAHVVATVKTHVFKQLSGSIVGMKRSAASLRVLGYMNSFRSTFRTVVKPRISFEFGDPDPEAEIYRLRCMRFFSTRLKTSVSKFVALRMFPTGDWRARDRIPVRLPGCEADWPRERLAQIRKLTTEGLLFCFCSSAPENFAAHHWTGHEACTCHFGLMESCCGLFSIVYPVWAASKGTKMVASSAPTCHPHNFAETLSSQLALCDVPSLASAEGLTGDSNPINLQEQMNAADRRIANAWALSQPLFELVLMRIVYVGVHLLGA
jgi:hypothetical protein